MCPSTHYQIAIIYGDLMILRLVQTFDFCDTPFFKKNVTFCRQHLLLTHLLKRLNFTARSSSSQLFSSWLSSSQLSSSWFLLYGHFPLQDIFMALKQSNMVTLSSVFILDISKKHCFGKYIISFVVLVKPSQTNNISTAWVSRHE